MSQKEDWIVKTTNGKYRRSSVTQILHYGQLNYDGCKWRYDRPVTKCTFYIWNYNSEHIFTLKYHIDWAIYSFYDAGAVWIFQHTNRKFIYKKLKQSLSSLYFNQPSLLIFRCKSWGRNILYFDLILIYVQKCIQYSRQNYNYSIRRQQQCIYFSSDIWI